MSHQRESVVVGDDYGDYDDDDDEDDDDNDEDDDWSLFRVRVHGTMTCYCKSIF